MIYFFFFRSLFLFSFSFTSLHFIYTSEYINDLKMFGQVLILWKTEDANQILSEYCRNGKCVKITLFRREREEFGSHDDNRVFSNSVRV